ncbi:hypothetical protein [Sorangium sp. So ce385]|uniref:hypothetical protein n=1 Tax=Sorangium sp. So ce385 TaxID=3133308 RepID=UPI003F5BF478
MTLRAMFNLPPPTDAEEFDAKVEDVLRIRHGNVHLIRYGRRGQRQSGIDGFDPVAPPGDDIVWQSTIRNSKVWSKLLVDLKSMDASERRPRLLVYAVGCERDTRIQDDVAALSAQRKKVGLCAVEVLFWNEIRQAILDHARLGPKWYPELFPSGRRPSVVRTRFVAGQADGVPADGHSAHRRVWQMLHLARISDVLSGAEYMELEGALAVVCSGSNDFRYWSNGKVASIGNNWYYPNGKHACIGDGWYYPNGKHACIGDGWYYPNGKHSCIGDNWYHPNGKPAGKEASVLAVALGMIENDERQLIVAGLRELEGQRRRLAVVDLAWAGYLFQVRGENQ